jgi:uncharacterized phage-associated protein
MRDVYDFAKYFIKNSADSSPNTCENNMKLQNLLALANMASVAEYGELLFPEEVLTSENGCFVEKVKFRYQNDYLDFKRESDVFQPDFSEREYYILNMVMSIFGNSTAKELSEINHTFNFWQEAYKNGTVVDMFAYDEDKEKMQEIILAFQKSSRDGMSKQIINGISFYYDFELNDDILKRLEDFTHNADEDTYTVYMDNGRLVIY